MDFRSTASPVLMAMVKIGVMRMLVPKPLMPVPYGHGCVVQLNKLRVYGGGPEYVKLGHSVLYEIEALEGWIAKHRRTSTSDRGEAA